MKAENHLSYKMWVYEMYRANTDERREYLLEPYPRLRDYVKANKTFLRAKYQEFCND